MDTLHEEYLSAFDELIEIDDSTVRAKLKEYEELGILKSRRQGRDLLYRRSDCDVDLQSWHDAVAFFSEADPMGVVGSFLLDKYTPLDHMLRVLNSKRYEVIHA